MRSSVFGVLGAALIGALPSCVYVPPEPAPPYPYVEPVPLAQPGPPRLCGRGWHWVRGHHDRSERWIAGHCVRNWMSPARSKEERSSTAQPKAAPTPPSAAEPSEGPPPPAPPAAGQMPPGR